MICMHVISLLTLVLSLLFNCIGFKGVFGGDYVLKIGKDGSSQVAHNASSNSL